MKPKVAKLLKGGITVLLALMSLVALGAIYRIVINLVHKPMVGLVMITVLMVFVFSLVYFVWGVSWITALKNVKKISEIRKRRS